MTSRRRIGVCMSYSGSLAGSSERIAEQLLDPSIFIKMSS